MNSKKILENLVRYGWLLTIPLLIILISSNQSINSIYFGNSSVDHRNLAEDNGESTVILLFMFFGLALGILAMQILSVVGEAIPYTCLVFLLGVLFSLAYSKNDGKDYDEKITFRFSIYCCICFLNM
jgi:hypothetical protein